MEKKRKARTSKPSQLEVENRKIGRLLYFFGSFSSRLRHIDYDISPLISNEEKKYLAAARGIIDSVKSTATERQRALVDKLREERNAS
jgi:hypothetical protein